MLQLCWGRPKVPVDHGPWYPWGLYAFGMNVEDGLTCWMRLLRGFQLWREMT